VSHSITDAEVRTVRSLCQRPELDTPAQIATGPYGEGLTAIHFAIALQGLRDKSIAFEEEGSWRLLPDARKELCTGDWPVEPREQARREEIVPEMPDGACEPVRLT
jgi:hypothetical protein